MESPEFREGDRVLFFPTKGSHDFEPATVVGVYPAGIPSCPQPMLKISSRAGVPNTVDRNGAGAETGSRPGVTPGPEATVQESSINAVVRRAENLLTNVCDDDNGPPEWCADECEELEKALKTWRLENRKATAQESDE